MGLYFQGGGGGVSGHCNLCLLPKGKSVVCMYFALLSVQHVVWFCAIGAESFVSLLDK